MANPKSLKIQRRDYAAKIDHTQIEDWHEQGAVATQFINTLSLLFPRGERVFIDAVRAHKDHPNVKNNAELMEQIKGFIGQEAMHTREHKLYNDAIEQGGVKVNDILNRAQKGLDFLRDHTSPKFQLAATIALEHYTALMGERLLSDERTTKAKKGAEDFELLWTWHAIEETEHKGVAYDVWKAVYGTNPFEYFYRSGMMLLSSGVFFAVVAAIQLQLTLRSEKAKKQGYVKGYYNLSKLFFGKIGFVRKSVVPFFDYFQYKFHPWDHNNLEMCESHKSKFPELFEKAA